MGGGGSKASTSASASAKATVPPLFMPPPLGTDGQGGTLGLPPVPGPGCSNTIENNSKTSSLQSNFNMDTKVSASVAGEASGGLFGGLLANIGGSASGSLAAANSIASNLGKTDQESNSKNNFKCNPEFKSKQVTNNTSTNSTDVDMGVTYMTSSALKSISENTNQMIVNSITNTTSNTSQTVNIKQTMVIKVSGCAGDLLVRNSKQNATIDLTQIATMTMTAIDQVRTDLAQSVLQQFKDSTTAQNNQILSNDIMTEIAAAQSASVDQKAASEITQKKDTLLPAANPTALPPENLSANVYLDQTTTNDVYNAVKISAPFLSKVDIDKTLVSIVNNSITQNFTKNTVNILAQTVIGEQSLTIDISDIGGNCTIENTEQNFNITLRQTLSSQLNIGTAIVASIANTLGVETDNSVAASNVQDLTSKIGNNLRTDQTSTQVAVSDQKYSQTITSGTGVIASCITYSILCTICCLCIFGGLGGLTAKAIGNSSESSDDSSEESTPEDSSEKSSPEDSSEKSSPEDSSSDNPEGGFSFFN